MASRFGHSLALVAGFAVALASGEVRAASAPATMCDSLAASPLDPDKPDHIEGVPFDTLDASEAAVEECRDSVADFPAERRFLTHLGRLYAKRGEFREAREVYRLAFARGSAVATNNLGALYESGQGVPQDDAKATLYYRKAANRGLLHALEKMGDRTRLGLGTPENLALSAYWYERASEAGDASATHKLGLLYRDGLGVRQDERKGFELVYQAVRMDREDAESIYSLAWAYETGSGTEPDLARALSLYRRAADLGDADAAVEAGRFFAEGLGMDPDPEQAAEWYALSAELGSIHGAVKLADAYSDGAGVEADSEQAREFYERALQRDPDDALRSYIESRLAALPFTERLTD